MTCYRNALPQLGQRMFITDGGIETTLIFHDGLTLPDFAAFDLFARPDGEAPLLRYFDGYARLAREHGTGLVLESATWRASADWGIRLGYTRAGLREVNRRAIALLEGLRGTYASDETTVVVSGCVGPRGDGYVPSAVMSVDEAQAYHAEQIETFAGTTADMITAITMNDANEATGLARAASRAGMPVAISFTVETDGALPTGQSLGDAIDAVDAGTGGYPSYYMINCAHPDHFTHLFDTGRPWTARVRGIRANASRRSHAELNDAAELDSGDPEELGRQYAALRRRVPGLTVMGGCCGTDLRHVACIARNCGPLFPRTAT